MNKQVDSMSLTKLVRNQSQSLRSGLISALDTYVVDQYEAKEALVCALINGLYNISRNQWALGAVFLGGPTGVGKTELVRSLSDILFGNPDAFVKIAGETMSHPGDISKLVGASPGYIGYGDTPLLSDKNLFSGYKTAKEKWTLHPILQRYEALNFSIILVDEVEKAHPDVPESFLNAIQSGKIDLSSGKEGSNTANSRGIDHSRATDLSNTLFVFTSNIGEHKIVMGKSKGIGFTESKNGSGDFAVFTQELKRHFSPAFIGRMDTIVRCHDLTEKQLRKIVSLQVNRVSRDFSKRYSQKIQIATSEAYVDYALGQAKPNEYGARAISGISKNIGTEVGLAVQWGKLPKNAEGTILFDHRDGEVEIDFFKQSSGLPEKKVPPPVNALDAQNELRSIVEEKINTYGKKVRETVQTYLSHIASYDNGFQKTCRILERRLRWYGFDSADIHRFQSQAFLDIYESDDSFTNDMIVRNEQMFDSIGFRTIEKYLRSAIVQGFHLDRIYKTITVLLKRPMTRDESIVVSQHIHRIYQTKTPRSRK